MIDATGAVDVYFEKEIEIVITEDGPFAMEKTKQILEDNEIEFTSIERHQAL